ncbi:major facilitator superfamily domain-containing protein [Dactylonectria macrodidyma]|uniref:Major facilitator superfamily domain-containing protein n=1 Tax=Dactylonectria macrodidyma TaxID=307937 RepID=A0A9P9IJ97_9HYPO|nr:major facilitator superfamily domain-containing protein [Dactylonectria macrodidyma]
MATSDTSDTAPAEQKLPGVLRMEALNSELTFPERCCLFLSIFFIAYAFVMDAVTRSTYQSYATSSYAQHSLLSTINVIKGVIAAAVQPLVAKLSDLIGRMELFLVLTAFYVLGSIIEASSTNVQGFAVGALFYQIGYISTISIFEIIIADLTSLRSRVFFIFIPNMPYIINTWVGGDVASAVLGATTWQWGIGMWCIIYPICSIPFIAIMVFVGRRAAKKQPAAAKVPLGSITDLFWKLDIVGIFLLTAVLSMILIPLTLAGGASQKWKTAGILTPLILGVLLMPVFVLWEMKASHPMIPAYLMRERGIWAALGLGTFVSFSYYTQADFLYTVLYVSYNFSVATATRVASVYSFCSVVGGAALGLVIFKVRRLKPFILGGLGLWLVAYGILIHFRGGTGGSSQAGVIAGQALLGIAGGSFPFPNLAGAQALAKHEDMAVVTSLLLTMNNVGVALGSCVSGAIWTQTLYHRLQKDLSPNAELAAAVYASPLYVVPEYPVGTEERAAIIESYQYIQRLLTITGICLTVPMVAFALCLRNTKLPKHKQTMV